MYYKYCIETCAGLIKKCFRLITESIFPFEVDDLFARVLHRLTLSGQIRTTKEEGRGRVSVCMCGRGAHQKYCHKICQDKLKIYHKTMRRYENS